VILEDLVFDAPKTKDYINLLSKLSLSDKKTILVLGENNPNVYLSSRNVQNAKVRVFSDLNTYELLDADSLVLCEGAVSKLETLLSK
jgi:large subunit ribosomal protein L4